MEILYKLKNGHISISYEAFEEVASRIGKFSVNQIISSDLPMNLLFEIASGGWTDTCQTELIMDHLAIKYVGMTFPCFGDPDELQKEFISRLKKLKGE